MNVKLKRKRIQAAVPDLEANAVAGPNTAQAVFGIDGEVFIGESKRAPGDPWNGQAAIDIALGRALIAAGEALVERGNEVSS